VGAHALGALAAGAAIVPFLQAYADSITRSVHSEFAKAHLPLSSGITYLLPEVYGNGRPDYTGPFLTYQLAAGYVGIAVLLLAGVALVRRRRDPLIWALGAVGALALTVVFAVPPVIWLVRAVPPFSEGNNLRVLYMVALVLAVLAGIGLDALLARPARGRRLALGLGAALAAAVVYLVIDLAAGEISAPAATKGRAVAMFAIAFALGAAVVWAAGRVSAAAAIAAALVVAVLELAYLQPWNTFVAPGVATPPTPDSIAFLQGQPGPFRLTGLWRGFGPPQALPANTAGDYGLESIQGYDFPLAERWSDLSNDVLGEHGLARELPGKTSPDPARPAARRALQMLNVRYYLALPDAPAPARGLRRVYAGRDATVFADPRALPRAYVVPRAVPATDGAALATLRAGLLDPRRVALVPAGVAGTSTGHGYAPARARADDPEDWRVALPRGHAGWLVFAASWSPLWKATVDGRDVATHPTDYALVGLSVPAGARAVELHYAATAAWWGFALSAAGWLGIAALAVLGRIQSRNAT
jgi:hypothetical protein